MTKYLKKAETDRKSRNDRRKTEKPSKSRIFLLKAEEVAALLMKLCFDNPFFTWFYFKLKLYFSLG